MINLEDLVLLLCLLCCISDPHGTDLFLNKKNAIIYLSLILFCYNHDTGGGNLLLAGIVLTICNSVLPQRI